MNIPDNMTEQQVVDTIMLVSNRMAPKYVFYGYTEDDLKQESFIICIEALNRYDGIRPLENFLSVNLSNRLKTFMRDKHFTGKSSEERKKVIQPAQLDYEDSIVDYQEKFSTSLDDLNMQDMTSIVDMYMPASLRMDYLRVLNDVYVSKQRREEINYTIRHILEEYGYDEEGEN